MRPTSARMSEMPGGKVYNVWWGDKNGAIKQKGITTYTISPWQTKAAPHWLKSYIFNGYRRISGEVLFFGIPMLAGYGVYTWAKSYDEWQNSKAGHLALGGEHHE
ncbi:hypothetical protein D9613_011040 [Agrocybe pediades]|uniref:Cytochrome b-c1 complex subunit 8 n=1 Tax=Agrocybe pediades TaxID=84607 RepID=A0A8H4VJD8_9AGAR|nr:hypothetical protein D9613_011040 [Agrocybe pediades]KAF9563857.1 hypothetical protein CPC08DRAFT_705776 [Agrocybe pediades]